MNLVFMGTPEFAVPCLEKLIQSHHNVLAVVTVPDKRKGRGLKIFQSPVKVTALEHDLPVLQPQDLSSMDFIDSLQAFSADLFVVVAFRILPPAVFEKPPKGTINLHSSLLPKYRGAAPINWAIINGEKETGVSTIFIQRTVDTGDLIFQEKLPIHDSETAGELHDRLAEMGANLLLKTVTAIEDSTAPRHVQIGNVTKAPKLSRDLARLDWAASSESTRNLVRGLNPQPGAFTTLNNKYLKIFLAEACAGDGASTEAAPGEVIYLDKKKGELIVATGDGCLKIIELQPEGKRRMSAHDFLLGNDLKVGDRFGT